MMWFARQFLQVFRQIANTLERIGISYRDSLNPRNPEQPPGY